MPQRARDYIAICLLADYLTFLIKVLKFIENLKENIGIYNFSSQLKMAPTNNLPYKIQTMVII